ncbi:hypothetical protein V3N99_17695 [Dermatophilaceae bacterium Soc4.6]
MTTGVITGTDEQILATGGGPEALVPGYPWQAHQLAHTLTTYATTLTDTAHTLARVEITGWTGQASDAAHTRLGQEPTRWATAAAAFDTAANALTRYADAFTPARRLAAEAAALYDAYLHTCHLIASTLSGSPVPTETETTTSIGQRISLLQTADRDPTTQSAAWDAEHLRRAAIETLTRARTILQVAGDDAADALVRALSNAPHARTFWQATIRPPGAEGAAHAGLDAFSLIPGWAGATATLLNASWLYTEGRHTDAGTTLAAGMVPFVGKGLKEGLATRDVLPTAAPAVVGRIAEASATRIADGHAWAKHVIDKGEFPEITTRQQFADLVQDVMLTGEARPSTAYPGKTYYWKDDTFVVIDPKNPDGGTAFRPTQGREYFDDQE